MLTTPMRSDLSHLFPVLFPCEPFESPVETVSAWRHQAKGEKAAGLTSAREHIVLDFYRCDLCGIGIGPRHHEKELYFCPIFERKELLGGDPWIAERATQVRSRALRICGGCARHRRIPENFLLISEDLWKAKADEISQVRQSIDHFLLWIDRILITIWFALYGFPLSFSSEPSPEKKPRQTRPLSPPSSFLTKGTHPLSMILSVPLSPSSSSSPLLPR